MTTLKDQAATIAAALKRLEQGEPQVRDPHGLFINEPTSKIIAACSLSGVTFAVLMDEKMVTIEIPWVTIRDSSEKGIAEFVLRQMVDRTVTIANP